MVVCSAFTFVYRFTNSNVILDSSEFVPEMIFLSEWIRILIIFTAADMPVTQVIQIDIDPESYHLCPIPNRIQVRLLRERLCTLSNSGSSKSLTENITVGCVSLIASSIANHYFTGRTLLSFIVHWIVFERSWQSWCKSMKNVSVWQPLDCSKLEFTLFRPFVLTVVFKIIPIINWWII